MLSSFPNLIPRLKTLVLMFIVMELEADLITAAAERKAELLRQANKYEQEDLARVAEQVRNQTEAIAPDKPLVSVAAAIKHLQTDSAPSAPADAVFGPLRRRGHACAVAPECYPTVKGTNSCQRNSMLVPVRATARAVHLSTWRSSSMRIW
jgi:hypothetical protein